MSEQPIMSLPDDLHAILRPGVILRQTAAPGIFSALPADAPAHPYDAKAALYDLIVGRRWYNRVIWGTNRDDFVAFEKLAVHDSRSGWMLDAGCGSLVFTHRVYVDYDGPPIVLADRSLGMLERARRRVQRRDGSTPAALVFLQADLLNMPFRAAAFETVSCPGLLHLFAEPAQLVRSLCGVAAPGARMFLTSLVTRQDRRFAARYLRFLERRGEVAAPRTSAEARAILSAFAAMRPLNSTTRGNMTYFANRPFWDATSEAGVEHG